MKLKLGYSPCPNDTFIFDAMVHHKIDTEGLEFEVILGDVEELNQRAFKSNLDITKLSYHAYAYLTDEYALLHSGSALGNNCGPLLISKSAITPGEVTSKTIAIPGKYTTANFLLSIAFPKATQKEAILFSDIEKKVLNEEVDLGLIIHENRFTYHERGLKKVMDLGAFWETKTGLPIPLGGIVVNRHLPSEIQQKVNRVLRKSVEFALKNPAQTLGYVEQHAQEMSHEVMMQHINLYVNDYSVDLGERGRKAILYMFEMAQEKGIVPKIKKELFV
ncbi:MAG: menaquinone biosynthesis family protein [Saprospiraceae bacterium]